MPTAFDHLLSAESSLFNPPSSAFSFSFLRDCALSALGAASSLPHLDYRAGRLLAGVAQVEPSLVLGSPDTSLLSSCSTQTDRAALHMHQSPCEAHELDTFDALSGTSNKHSKSVAHAALRIIRNELHPAHVHVTTSFPQNDERANSGSVTKRVIVDEPIDCNSIVGSYPGLIATEDDLEETPALAFCELDRWSVRVPSSDIPLLVCGYPSFAFSSTSPNSVASLCEVNAPPTGDGPTCKLVCMRVINNTSECFLCPPLWIISCQPLHSGDEITVGYGEDYWARERGLQGARAECERLLQSNGE